MSGKFFDAILVVIFMWKKWGNRVTQNVFVGPKYTTFNSIKIAVLWSVNRLFAIEL
jgi:hypothetical protein